MKLRVSNVLEIWESAEEGTQFSSLHLTGKCGCAYKVVATEHKTMHAVSLGYCDEHRVTEHLLQPTLPWPHTKKKK